MTEDLKDLSLKQLKARLSRVIPTIDLLTHAWNGPELTAAMVLSFKIDNKHFTARVIDCETFPDNNVLREFIHNFCTNLCAEKLLLEDLISKKS